MKLASMRFKTFVWPHNPRVYSIRFERNMAMHKIPYGRYVLQNLGLSMRVLKGEGEFVGEDAYRQFKTLAKLFYEGTAGTLVHPLWDATTAWLVDLKLEQEPRPDYVKYSFTFWEDIGGPYGKEALRGEGTGSGSEAGNRPALEAIGDGFWHTVVKGESLWAIANRYGLSLPALMELNPQIKNPNLIRVGEKVRVG